MAWLTSPAWVALFLRATGSLAAIFTANFTHRQLPPFSKITDIVSV